MQGLIFFDALRSRSHLKRKLFNFICSAAVLMILLLVSTAGTAKAGTAADVRPEPLLFTVEVGQVSTLDILLENAVDVYGIDVSGQFDVQAIEVVDANLAIGGVQMVPGIIPKPDWVFINSADNLTGSFQYVDTQLNPTPPVSGSGIVFSIQVRGKTIGETVFAISSVLLADRDGMSLPVTPLNGTIRVVPEAVPFVIFLPLLPK
jgi:hypothetical protein